MEWWQQIPALSVRQPWAWALMRGGKDVENRGWTTHYRGPLWIHAAAGMTAREYQEAAAFFPDGVVTPEPAALVRGAILGVVDLIDVVTDHPSPWFVGAFGWVVANPRPLRAPIPCRGALGLWRPPAALVAAVVW